MAFSPIPDESKSQINKAGQILAKGADTVDAGEFLRAMELVNEWRACHAYPINTFQATLRDKVRAITNDPIVAQRLKRMPTIINKLRIYPAMQLTTMQDIAGVRAVLGTVEDVYKLADSYRKNTRFNHQLVDQKDYIQNPRSEDGYRSIHLMYRYKNKTNPSYDGLRIEMQIRTRLQHTWATSVETMGTFLGQALKSRQGDQDWLDFFAITSSAFAYKENCNLVPRYDKLSREATFQAVAEMEAKLGALEKMKGFSSAVEEITGRHGIEQSSSYHLIILNSLEKTVQIKAYNRESFESAIADYSEVEKEAAQGKKLEPVLVSAGPMRTLRRAYPNFFLDITDFVKIVSEILQTASQVKQYQIPLNI